MRWLAYILAALLLVDTAHSQVIDGVEIVKPRIITGEWDPVTKRFPIAIEFAIAPKWHLYWLNPGDAGSPPKVTWRIPSTWKPQGLQFPVPAKVEEDEMVSFAYYDTLVLVEEIYSPVKPTNEPIEATIKWMVCKDICVPGEMDISGSYGDLKTTFEWPKLPLLPTLAEAGYSWKFSSDGFLNSFGYVGSLVEISSSANPTVKVDEFFPLISSELPLHARAHDGNIEFGGSANQKRAPHEALNGLVFIDDKVYWLKQP